MKNYKEIKKAKTDYPIHNLLEERYSPRFLSTEEIPNQKLQSIFEAGRWAPSAYNNQPWHFIVGRKGDSAYDAIFNSMIDFNKQWTANSPILAVSIAKTVVADGKSNPTAVYDLGQSVAMMVVQAMKEGVFFHQMTGFDIEKAEKDLGIPKDYKIVSAFTLSYLGDGIGLPDYIEKSENEKRERRPLSETVFSNKFGDKAFFL